ncbi:hypothetical protein GCM10027515_29240 [Schumannella luteola]|uniref:Uncharacterized small protein (DUF1192 family) n=1 Tax=Schumannella luteola TaxID=472059 RepID=A0A852Y8J3_9MICO|nr:DUF4349 domain-containing protein [Schumannella luteola]NYG99276.1 uncharacterized small protein (DUF1192 family) [Schumannella luteola]TPX02116.1 DUF4349 domain-containing protein [Schumannella luteola]
MRRIPLLLGTAALIVALAGCTSASGGSRADQSGTSGGRGSDSSTQDSAVDGSAQSRGDADSATSDPAALPATVDPSRSVVTTGSITLTVDDPGKSADAAVTLTTDAGGRIDGRQEQAASGDSPATAQLTLRIPADALDATLPKLKKLGHLESVQLTSDDVTATVRDTDARITALQTSVDRLTALLAKSGTTADLVALESALSQRQAELESLQAQKRGLDDQVELSTITLDLLSPAAAPTPKPQSFLDGLAAGWGAFLAFWAGFLVVLGALTPWLIALAIIGGVVLLIVRRRRRSRPVGRPGTGRFGGPAFAGAGAHPGAPAPLGDDRGAGGAGGYPGGTAADHGPGSGRDTASSEGSHERSGDGSDAGSVPPS